MFPVQLCRKFACRDESLDNDLLPFYFFILPIRALCFIFLIMCECKLYLLSISFSLEQ